MQMKEEWRFVAMECGGLYTVDSGIVLTLLLLASNFLYIKPIQVCLLCVANMKLLELSLNRSGSILWL